jgi:lipopolysaccharide transport system ATP-binding protein
MTMSSTAIRCLGLSKSYRIRPSGPRYRTLRTSLGPSIRRLLTPNAAGESESVWALQDISFDMKPGEALGIIGSNGAGKSTLLKILSRITPPTRGHAEVRGRVGSLLEVGTGFHQELTGRDNVYLNGAILGMSRHEIARRFDEIVAFAGVEKFLETPLKHYSSGMYMRLAFAVAAHLETEILIVDEVLAVGDAEFQRKCIGKMEQVAGQGRTILFVSHNMAAIQSICRRSIWIEHGRLMFDGESTETVHRYLSSEHSSSPDAPGTWDLTARQKGLNSRDRVFRQLKISSGGRTTETVLMGNPLDLEIEVEKLSEIAGMYMEVKIMSEEGDCRVYFCTDMKPPRTAPLPRTDRELLVVSIPRLPLTAGTYSIDLWCHEHQMGVIDSVQSAGRLVVGEADVYGTGYKVREGALFFEGSWKLLPAAEEREEERPQLAAHRV